MNNHFITKWLLRHLDDEDHRKFEHMQKRRAESRQSLKTSMISHLSALNDGVIAIFITVMMLEIPYPKMKSEYSSFMWSIAVFLVSFFIIAEFWYDNKRIFEVIREADHLVVVSNFLFLASLALIPATTKWIMNQTDRHSELTFGIVYFITLFFEQLLNFAALRKRFSRHRALFFTIIFARVGVMVVGNLLLMLLAWFYPRQAMILYITLPIIGFFRPEKEG